eukprot:m.254452 g.254452  ORF g.254452 m.254452 type:complete len:383 (-) comp26539_c1_seq14:2505-3653(-)
MALPMVEVVDGVASGQWLDTGLDADAVEFCPRAGYNQWAVIGTYKLRESEAGGRAEQQSRDGTLLLVEVAEPDAPGQRVCATPTAVLKAQGIFDIKWAGAVGSESEGAPILGHAAADGSLCTYTLAVGEGGSEAATSDQSSATADAPAAPTSASDQGGAGGDPGDASSAGNGAAQPRMRLHPLGRIDCTADGVSVGSSLSLSLDWNDRKIGNQEPTVAVSMSDGTVCTCRVGQTVQSPLGVLRRHGLLRRAGPDLGYAPIKVPSGTDVRWGRRVEAQVAPIGGTLWCVALCGNAPRVRGPPLRRGGWVRYRKAGASCWGTHVAWVRSGLASWKHCSGVCLILRPSPRILADECGLFCCFMMNESVLCRCIGIRSVEETLMGG